MEKLFRSARIDLDATETGVVLTVLSAEHADAPALLGVCPHGCATGAPLNGAQCFDLGTALLGRALTIDSIGEAIARVNKVVRGALRLPPPPEAIAHYSAPDDQRATDVRGAA
jgi:hypothetical protein